MVCFLDVARRAFSAPFCSHLYIFRPLGERIGSHDLDSPLLLGGRGDGGEGGSPRFYNAFHLHTGHGRGHRTGGAQFVDFDRFRLAFELEVQHVGGLHTISQ